MPKLQRTAACKTRLGRVQVRDLLSQDLTVEMELQKTATGFALPGLIKVPVTSAEQITEVMQKGYESRCTAAHDINAHSSRSHALLIVEVASVNLASGIKSVGKLTLCDLAGRCAAHRSCVNQTTYAVPACADGAAARVQRAREQDGRGGHDAGGGAEHQQVAARAR